MNPKFYLNTSQFKKAMLGSHFYSIAIFIFVLCTISTATLSKEIDIQEITAKPLRTIIKRTGTLDFKHTVKLSFKSSGYLKVLNVDVGDLFLSGKLLASLDRYELDAQKNATYAKLRQAKNDVERIEALLEKDLSSEQKLEIMKTIVHTSRSAYKIAYYNLEKAELKASFDGVVLSRTSELGEFQSPGQEALKVAALTDNLIVKVALTGKEVSTLVVNQQVMVTLPSAQQVSGKVSKIAVEADPQSHLFMVEVLLPSVKFKNGAIAGQFAQVIIDGVEQNLSYQVPIEALIAVNEQGKALLMIQSASDPKEIQQQSFEIIKLDNHYVYIAADNESEHLQVIIRGWQQLSHNNSQTLD